MQTINFRGNRDDVGAVLRQLMSALAGRGGDPYGVVTGIQLRCANALLSKIQKAFVTKSRGGTDEAGISWPPLQRATIANRRPAPRKKRGDRPRGLLTATEDKRWRTLFARKKSQLVGKLSMDDKAASGRAAQHAWAVLKGEGAKTKLAVYGGRQVDILRDTAELFRSFSPGKEEQRSGADGQILKTFSGVITVGTNKKTWHHRGVPGKLPSRPFWPLDGHIPTAWWTAVNVALNRGITAALAQILSRRAA